MAAPAIGRRPIPALAAENQSAPSEPAAIDAPSPVAAPRNATGYPANLARAVYAHGLVGECLRELRLLVEARRSILAGPEGEGNPVLGLRISQRYRAGATRSKDPAGIQFLQDSGQSVR